MPTVTYRKYQFSPSLWLAPASSLETYVFRDEMAGYGGATIGDLSPGVAWALKMINE